MGTLTVLQWCSLVLGAASLLVYFKTMGESKAYKSPGLIVTARMIASVYWLTAAVCALAFASDCH